MVAAHVGPVRLIDNAILGRQLRCRPRPASRTAQVRLPDLAAWKADGRPIVMVTAYDHPSAEVVDAAGVDIVLVGDSAANVVLGYDSTVPVTVDELLVLVRAVHRGLRRPLLVADLPFGSYEVSDAQAVATAIRFVKEGGAAAVKLERGGTSARRAAAIVAAGIPVMGHVGLTPQTATALGGYRAQGRQGGQAAAIVRRGPRAAGRRVLRRRGRSRPRAGRRPHAGRPRRARHRHRRRPRRRRAGARAARPRRHDAPTARPASCGATAACAEALRKAVAAYADDVRERRFPTAEHTYPISDAELAAFRELVAQEHP